MKKTVLAAAAASIALATPAIAAETASKDFDIKASVAPECSIENPSNQTYAIEIDRSAGEGALLMTAGASSVDRLWMSCNYNADITVDATPLLNDDGLADNDPNDFTDQLVYDLTLENESKSSGGPFPKFAIKVNGPKTVTQPTAGAFHENAHLAVQIKPANNPKRPVAGDYNAVATISLGAL